MIDKKWIDKIIIVVVALLVVCIFLLFPQSDYNSNKGVRKVYEESLFGGELIDVNIEMPEDDWQALIENSLNEEYSKADVTINGREFTNVGVRPKGEYSLKMVKSMRSERYSLKIKFDEYIDGQNCDGLSKLVLNNNFLDATLMKEAITYDMFAYLGADASLYNYAKVSINGKYFGLYLALEPVEEEWCERIYGKKYGKLYKPEPNAENNASNMIPEFMNAPDLSYRGDEIETYKVLWDGAVFSPTLDDKNRVIEALRELCGNDLSYETISNYIDIDNMAKYMAVHTFVVNLDSLTTNRPHNYYLYENHGKINIIPWDYNLAFGGMNGQSTYEYVNFSISWPFDGPEEDRRKLFYNLLENEEFHSKYYENLKKLSSKYVYGGLFESKVKEIRSKIDDLEKTDPTAFYKYDQYVKAQDTFDKVIKLRAEAVLAQIKKDGAKVDTGKVDLIRMGGQGGQSRNIFGRRETF